MLEVDLIFNSVMGPSKSSISSDYDVRTSDIGLHSRLVTSASTTFPTKPINLTVTGRGERIADLAKFKEQAEGSWMEVLYNV